VAILLKLVKPSMGEKANIQTTFCITLSTDHCL